MKFLRRDIAVASYARIAFAFWLTWVLITPAARPGPSRQNFSPSNVAPATRKASARAKSPAFALPAVTNRVNDRLEMDEDDDESTRQPFDPRDVWIPVSPTPVASGCTVGSFEPPPALPPSRLRC